jgi:hypothetical protein
MGHEDAPTPDFNEGEVEGYEFNALNGRRYAYKGHYLGDGTIIYRANVLDANGEYRGELSGVFDHVKGGPAPKTQVESMLKAAIRESVGYRS